MGGAILGGAAIGGYVGCAAAGSIICVERFCIGATRNEMGRTMESASEYPIIFTTGGAAAGGIYSHYSARASAGDKWLKLWLHWGHCPAARAAKYKFIQRQLNYSRYCLQLFPELTWLEPNPLLDPRTFPDYDRQLVISRARAALCPLGI